MPNLNRFTFNVTCTASNATYTQYIARGYLEAIRYTTATASAFATGATASIAIVPESGNALTEVVTFVGTSVAAMLFPRREGHTTAGATGGHLGQRIPIVGELIRLRVASGGAAGRGIFDFYVDGE